MSPAVRHLPPAEVRRRHQAIVDLYREVYAEPPYHEGDQDAADFADRFTAHVASSGFELVTCDEGDQLIGCAYGVAFGPDRWWRDADACPPVVVGSPKFAVMEFMVRKQSRQQGVGSLLMKALLDARPERFATLCANPASAAREIYRRWGWQEVAKTRSPRMPPMDVLLLDRC